MVMINKINQKSAIVGVIGLGYVGLPLAIEIAKAGFKVIGIDLNKEKVELIQKGISYVIDISNEELQMVLKQGNFKVTTDYAALNEVDIIDIAVPTPLSKSRTPDISYIVRAMESIKTYFTAEKLIILESTTYPGTTRELIVNELELLSYKLDQDFYAAFSPERVDPGNKIYQIKNTPKVVGGASSTSTRLAVEFYSMFIDTVVAVDTCEEAEMSKLLENTFRAINIGFINELAVMCDRMGINIWNVVEAAKTKPFGFMPFYPGPGIGGHCIPLDPMYLSWKAKHYGFYNRAIELASDINENMPDFVVEKLLRIMNQSKKVLNGSKVLVLGMAYKKDIDDIRESPALVVFDKLKRLGAELVYYDPFIARFEDYDECIHVGLSKLTKEDLNQADIVIVLTAHSCFDYKFIEEHAQLIFDTRNVFSEFNSEKVKAL